ncbi:nucleotidyltransferase family protein [uncultured Tateyamaria sp.]|uniref:nucleotidyltransferase family protein n=1 Tax=uncultured Tateyamaria sp. TaxID=455651 RepID=UPI002622A5D6|nr:nucleotidyltransferase family protein [uncultured Tateyamaria sp.]
MPDVAAIILAAGLSRRMGERNKLLLPVGGVPMIRHVVSTYLAVVDGPVLVVTGHEADLVEASLDGCDVEIVHNAAFADGQQTSVACGLRAVPQADQILIGLGDQPTLTRDDLQDLLDAHKAAETSRISIPLLNNQRGNPILVPGMLRDRLLADPRSPGCKTFTRAHPEHVQFHALPSPGFYADVDTPDAYRALTADPSEGAE